jgi:hypothetical protein
VRHVLTSLAIAVFLLVAGAPAWAQFPSTESPPDSPATETPPAASPEPGGPNVLDDAAAALRSNPVYVHPRAERAISDTEARRLRERITAADAGPLYLAILPGSAADAAGGDPDQAMASLARRVNEPGTYVGLIGGALRAGATSERILPQGRAGRLAADALREHRDDGTMPVLLNLVDRIGRARADAGSGGSGSGGGGGDGGGSGLFLLALLGIPAALMFVGSRRRRRRQAQLEERELAELKEFTRDDVIALGQDIRDLDIDVEMPNTPPAARDDYARALERYEEADTAWEQASRPEDLERVASLLEDGRHAIASTRARIEGRPPPERRPPCFFDPRHGPSVEDIEWAPDGGAPRPVPVCAADAQRVRDGEEPHIRRVGDAPYWDAGPQYMPWATGFFGGGLVPGLFFGSMLGAGFGMFGSPFLGGGAWASGGEDFGGGDFGGGDFGGGDFGGGDFGGGDFGGGDFG